MKILYYTGTGNSLYVAKEFGGELISIPKAVRQGIDTICADEIGIVCPLYCHMPPNTVQDFLKTVSLEASYIFVIFTYGNRKCDAFEWMDSFAKEHNFSVDYIDAIKMVDNYLPSFDMAEQMAMDKDVEGQVKQVIENVKAHKSGYEKTIEEEIQHHKKIMEMAEQSPELFDGSLLAVSDACIGCGICTKVCPLGKYSVVNGRAVREKGGCDYCQACAQNCPNRAIIPGKTDKNPNARFRNEHISLKELIEANNNGQTTGMENY